MNDEATARESAIVPVDPSPNAITARGPGRPSSYSPETAAAMLARYAAGETIKQICDDEAMPSHTTFREWKHTREDFRAALARAKVDRAEVMADRALSRLEAVDPDSPYGSARVSLAREKAAYDWKYAEVLDREGYGQRPAVEVKIGEVTLAYAKLTTPPKDDAD